MKPQTKSKSDLMVRLLLLTLIGLIAPRELQATSISEELLKTELTATGSAVATQKQSVKLSVSPKQCVAMQQGQRCYLQVNVDFTANTVDDYCLYLSTQQAALQCWKNSRQGQLNYAFDSKVDIEFAIKVPRPRKQPLAKAKVKMAWVHEKKGKPRMSWRLF